MLLGCSTMESEIRGPSRTSDGTAAAPVSSAVGFAGADGSFAFACNVPPFTPS